MKSTGIAVNKLEILSQTVESGVKDTVFDILYSALDIQ